jgi:hypothetical protein
MPNVNLLNNFPEFDNRLRYAIKPALRELLATSEWFAIFDGASLLHQSLCGNQTHSSWALLGIDALLKKVVVLRQFVPTKVWGGQKKVIGKGITCPSLSPDIFCKDRLMTSILVSLPREDDLPPVSIPFDSGACD